MSTVTPSKLNSTAINKLKAVNFNYVITVASKNVTQGGKTNAGEWIDIVRFRDWLQNDMSQLLIDHKNIHFDSIDNHDVKLLNRDELDEIFCMELQDMFLLAFEVLKLNYSGFFRKLASRYGNLDEILEKLGR